MPPVTRTTESHQSERRGDRRYPIDVELVYSLIRRGRVVQNGLGRTVNLSTGGILFEADRTVLAGLEIELSLAWPALLNNVAPLKLCVAGRTVRSHDNRIAVRVLHHHFRTGRIRNRPDWS